MNLKSSSIERWTGLLSILLLGPRLASCSETAPTASSQAAQAAGQQAAVPGLRTISVIVPQARVLNMAQSLATDSYAFVGSAEAEMKLSDSVTGALLVEAVDQLPAAWGSRVQPHSNGALRRTQWITGRRKYRIAFRNCKESPSRARTG
jgi:uncharacterized protein (DUF1810 family)